MEQNLKGIHALLLLTNALFESHCENQAQSHPINSKSMDKHMDLYKTKTTSETNFNRIDAGGCFSYKFHSLAI